MRFLADESIPRGLVEALQDHNETVLWLRTTVPGISDQKVLELAQTAPYILLTFDQNLAESAYRTRLPQTSGVILLRFRLLTPEYISEIGAAAIVSRDDWAGHFAVIEGDRVRMRRLLELGKQGAIEQAGEKEQKAEAETETEAQKVKTGGASRAKSTRASAAKTKSSKTRTSRTKSPKSEQS